MLLGAIFKGSEVNKLKLLGDKKELLVARRGVLSSKLCFWGKSFFSLISIWKLSLMGWNIWKCPKKEKVQNKHCFFFWGGKIGGRCKLLKIVPTCPEIMLCVCVGGVVPRTDRPCIRSHSFKEKWCLPQLLYSWAAGVTWMVWWDKLAIGSLSNLLNCLQRSDTGALFSVLQNRISVNSLFLFAFWLDQIHCMVSDTNLSTWGCTFPHQCILLRPHPCSTISSSSHRSKMHSNVIKTHKALELILLRHFLYLFHYFNPFSDSECLSSQWNFLLWLAVEFSPFAGYRL